MSAAELRAALAKKEKAESSEKQSRISAYNKKRNDFVDKSVERFNEINEMLSEFKSSLIAEGRSLHKDMYAVYDKEEKDLKSFTLFNAEKKTKAGGRLTGCFGFRRECRGGYNND